MPGWALLVEELMEINEIAAVISATAGLLTGFSILLAEIRRWRNDESEKFDE